MYHIYINGARSGGCIYTWCMVVLVVLLLVVVIAVDGAVDIGPF